jgi:cellulose synthase/poly-beta-1,6-N-acetylglucosamine synthase-like glycosyltransferase/peptidoglycan/xylan/chitin deacetylase (PgdA/CDA1 family)/spore germination protein YaaH
MEKNRTIFFDAKGKRSRYTGRISLFIGFITLVLVGIFITSLFIQPIIPKIRLKPTQPANNEYKEDYQKNAQEVAKVEAAKRNTIKQEKQQKAEAFFASHPQPTPQNKPGKPLAIGFYVNWDDSSYTSLKRNFNQLDWLVPEWIRLSGDNKNPLVLDVDQKAVDLIRQEKPTMPILPLVQNYKNEQWNPQILSKAIETEESRQNLINTLVSTVLEHKFGGITIDLEEVPSGTQSNLFKFMEELHEKFAEKNLIVAQAVPFNNPDWNYKAYANVTDYLMLMAYDQHWETSEPGPVAGQDWFENVLKQRMSELDPNKTVVCIGNYGYNWTNGTKHGEDISFQEAVLAAKESLDSPKDIKFEEPAKNPHFSYVEEDGKTHSVWFLDSVTAYNEMTASKNYNVAGFALWRLGSEDPSLWNIFGTDKQLTTEGLDKIKYSYDVDFEGTGEILQVRALPQDGVRNLKTDDNNSLSESFESVPSSYVMQRTGDQQGKIVLTFDDGPDPTWTPKILDVLKEKGIKATFFIIGENGQENPELVKRIVAEGHEIGNHSFTHPNLGEVPQAITEVELNATQRLIESLTGRSTRLFRAPYFGDAEPRTPGEVEPTVLAQKLGYITVGLHLDPDDWKLTDDNGNPRTADDLVNETIKAAAITTPEERGNIVLLHDGGGNRQATVEALPRIIDELRGKGYQFTTVADLAGISQEQAMPVVPQNQNYFAHTNSFVFYGISTGQWLIKWLFLIGIFLGLARVVFIGFLAFIQYLKSKKRDEIHFGEGFNQLISVVVPAFNEEKVICRTIESLLNSDYENFEIIVVDDGSSDKTFEIATEKFGQNGKIHIYRKENGGKAAALNFGWQHARGEIIVALDADTIFKPDTISELVKRFADKKIGAVAGNAKVGNRLNLVTKWQALEYITSQNFDRRAFSLLNCITVVPGSVGAWRRDVLEKTGGFSNDTLAEDQDLTIQVRKLGYEIGYTENAIGLTEAPDSLRGLAKQRFRWSYGTLQCLWKHKNALFNPKYGTLGFVAMPNVWIFQVIFPLISPLMDLMFIWTFLSSALGYLEHQHEYSPTNLTAVMFYYGLFLVVDLLGAAFAFGLEKREQSSLLWRLPIQRFGYRQVIYYVMVKSVLTAIRGSIVGWGKLERKATVSSV